MDFLTSNFCINVVPLIASVCLVICYYPQLRKTYKTKDVEGFSLMFWIVLCIALSCFVINALSLLANGAGSYGYLIAEVLNLSMAGAILTMVIKYRKPEDKQIRKVPRKA